LRIEIFSGLDSFFRQFQGNITVAELKEQFLSTLKNLADPEGVYDQTGYLRSVYETAVNIVEREAADRDFDKDLLSLQRDLYRELENILQSESIEKRHHFLIAIPVADRPIMLESCIDSLAEQCRLFNYGGTVMDAEGKRIYQKITAFIIDDSQDKENIQRTRDLCSKAVYSGVRTIYVGLPEQTEIISQLPAGLKKQFQSILGNTESAQPRKGASISRNLAYLYLNAFLRKFREKALIYFLDSDEAFRIKVKRGAVIEDLPFVNYFYCLDKLFSSGDFEVVTGKVVGDPPVSCSVMIGTFLEDISLFLESVAKVAPDSRCAFHDQEPARASAAEYHDMAGLFGYKGLSHPMRYQCSLSGIHSMRECLDDFSKKALGFFNGLHPTRTQFYVHGADFKKTTPARTVYTGNYVFTPAGLRHFIPFANLKLRMAGPSLGRILKKRLGQKFVSANLPLLHRRTTPETYGNEFRAGILAANNSIDASLELNRQFWGDVMLFTIEQITELGYPDDKVGVSEIASVATEVQYKLWTIYKERQDNVKRSAAVLRNLLSLDMVPWLKDPKAESAMGNIKLFCDLAENNFGSDSAGFKDIELQIEQGSVLKELINAISSFQDTESAWDKILKSPFRLH
jgi:hypothetical protein